MEGYRARVEHDIISGCYEVTVTARNEQGRFQAQGPWPMFLRIDEGVAASPCMEISEDCRGFLIALRDALNEYFPGEETHVMAVRCSTCKGTGHEYREFPSGWWQMNTCPECQGQGCKS